MRRLYGVANSSLRKYVIMGNEAHNVLTIYNCCGTIMFALAMKNIRINGSCHELFVLVRRASLTRQVRQAERPPQDHREVP